LSDLSSTFELAYRGKLINLLFTVYFLWHVLCGFFSSGKDTTFKAILLLFLITAILYWFMGCRATCGTSCRVTGTKLL
jgi:ABC-type uncharacterized transport system permease subunit